VLRAVRTRLAPKVDPKLGNSDEGGESVSGAFLEILSHYPCFTTV